MNIRFSVLLLVVIALTASCGQEKQEPALLDSMPSGYEVYITINPSQIGADSVLSEIGESVAQTHQQMPFPIADILGFDPFDWDSWVDALALDPAGEIGMVIAFKYGEPELITLFLPSTDPSRVQGFIDGLIAQAPDMDVLPLITESEGYAVLAFAPEQSILDDFNTSLGTLNGSDESFTQLRNLSIHCTPGMEMFINGEVLADSELEGMLVTCYSEETNLTAQFVARVHSAEVSEYAAAVSGEPSGDIMKIPADATAAMHAAVDMAVIKEMLTESLPPDAQMVAAMLGFDSLSDIIDIFSGDAWLAFETDGNSYSGMIAYGISDSDALLELIEGLTGMLGMSGEEFDSFQFQGNTCLSIETEGMAGIETIEIGMVDDVFVVAGGYTLEDVADGIAFGDFLDRTGHNIDDEGGFALAADIGVLAGAYDLNSMTGNTIDFEDFGFVSMSGTYVDDIYDFQVSIDFGTGNPFAYITDVITMMAFPRFAGSSTVPVQVDQLPVLEDSIIETRSNPPEDEYSPPDSFYIESPSEPADGV